MRKKMIALSLAVALIVVAAIGGTMAYFTDNEEKTNIFTMGDVDITLTETEWDANEDAHGNVAPGITYAKDPVVTNVGNNPAWIRVDVTLSDADAFKAAAENHQMNDINLANIFSGHNAEKWTLAGDPVYVASNGGTLTYSYYYNDVLEPGLSTEALFTAVKIPAEFNNADMKVIGADFTIKIQAHAIQDADDTDGFTSPQGAFAKYELEEK